MGRRGEAMNRHSGFMMAIERRFVGEGLKASL